MAEWPDVDGRAVQSDGTLDPAHLDPLRLRIWIQPDRNLEYEVLDAEVKASHGALDLEVAWGTAAPANNLAMLDILGTTLGLELEAGLDDGERISQLDWQVWGRSFASPTIGSAGSCPPNLHS